MQLAVPNGVLSLGPEWRERGAQSVWETGKEGGRPSLCHATLAVGEIA